MRLFLRLILAGGVVAGIAGASYKPLKTMWHERTRPRFESVEVARGSIQTSVSATGKVEPKLKFQIGAFVSGPIIKLYADFNDQVKKGDPLADIDPTLYEANVRRDEAALATRKAEIARIDASLKRAVNDERRGFSLREENPDFIAEAELDRLRFGRMALEAELDVAKASVIQAEANLENSRANLNYTKITSPCDGMVIDRKIEPGQTLASTFQTPELFVLGVDMNQEMFVYASVDEAEIGLIRQAQANNKPVKFRVSAYQDDLFEGRIHTIRLSSTETQNVVTYPVIVVAPNPELKLLPGMTATLTFEVEDRTDALRIPWSALRYFPIAEHVRPEDRHLLEGNEDDENDEEETAQTAAQPTAEELVEARRSERRHVWVQDGELLRAIEVRLGISDYKHAECLEGEIQPGMKLVTGLEKKR